MSWSFLTPLYLLGGIAIAIPLWVHWRNQQPIQTYPFPTLQFLLRTKISMHRWRELMRWIVLVLRLAAFSALILAFAQPWKHVAPTPTGEFSVLIIDVSCSMQAEGAWKEAQNAALRWLEDEKKKARTAIVTMGRSADVLASFEQPAEDQRSVLQTLSPTFEATNPEPAIRLAEHILETQPARHRKITVISDMAASAWQHVDWDRPLSPGIVIEPHAVLPEAPDNIALTEIRTPQSFWQTNIPFTVTGTIKNFSPHPYDIRVSLKWNVRQTEMESIHLDAKSTREIPFSVVPSELLPIQGRIQMEVNDHFTPDNERFFVVTPRRPTRIGRLTSTEKNDDIFLKTALIPQIDSSVNRYQWVPLNPQSSLPIQSSADILLIDQGLTSLSTTCAQNIKTFVQEGGSIVLFLGKTNSLAEWEKEWLPINLGKKCNVGLLSEAQHFAEIQSTHPMLHPFFLPGGGNLFRVQVQQWREFKVPLNKPLIQLPNGDPVLSLLPSGKGQVAVLAFPLTREWSDWPIHATFLPWLHQLLGSLEQKVAPQENLVVGDSTPDGQPITQPGFYGSKQDPKEIRAANLDPSESDFTRWTSLANFQQLQTPEKVNSSFQANILSIPENGTDFSKWLLLAVAIFSLSEAILANRTPR